MSIRTFKVKYVSNYRKFKNEVKKPGIKSHNPSLITVSNAASFYVTTLRSNSVGQKDIKEP